MSGDTDAPPSPGKIEPKEQNDSSANGNTHDASNSMNGSHTKSTKKGKKKKSNKDKDEYSCEGATEKVLDGDVGDHKKLIDDESVIETISDSSSQESQKINATSSIFLLKFVFCSWLILVLGIGSFAVYTVHTSPNSKLSKVILTGGRFISELNSILTEDQPAKVIEASGPSEALEPEEVEVAEILEVDSDDVDVASMHEEMDGRTDDHNDDHSDDYNDGMLSSLRIRFASFFSWNDGSNVGDSLTAELPISSGESNASESLPVSSGEVASNDISDEVSIHNEEEKISKEQNVSANDMEVSVSEDKVSSQSEKYNSSENDLISLILNFSFPNVIGAMIALGSLLIKCRRYFRRMPLTSSLLIALCFSVFIVIALSIYIKNSGNGSDRDLLLLEMARKKVTAIVVSSSLSDKIAVIIAALSLLLFLSKKKAQVSAQKAKLS